MWHTILLIAMSERVFLCVCVLNVIFLHFAWMCAQTFICCGVCVYVWVKKRKSLLFVCVYTHASVCERVRAREPLCMCVCVFVTSLSLDPSSCHWCSEGGPDSSLSRRWHGCPLWKPSRCPPHRRHSLDRGDPWCCVTVTCSTVAKTLWMEERSPLSGMKRSPFCNDAIISSTLLAL